jgi:aspartate-semialdehyde dehydrogenase
MTRRGIRTAVLGASGYIGQQFVRLLADHPYFAEPTLVASERAVGRPLEDFWVVEAPLPAGFATRKLELISTRSLVESRVEVAFSALPSGIAGPIETELTRRGVAVFSNAADHRRDRGVPLLLPEVNAAHLRALSRRKRGTAPLVTNPNCTATGLALALAPVWRALDPREVHVSTYQALSGAGLPGISSLHATANIVPFIPGEEEKVSLETTELLETGGALVAGRREVPIVVQAVRVPVRDGHLEAVTVVARRRPTAADLRELWRAFDPLGRLALPTAPHPPVVLREEPDRPQPLRDRWAGSPPRARGMAAVIGRVRWVPPYLRFFVLSHNAVRGGAGGSVLNAELALAEGYLPGP